MTIKKRIWYWLPTLLWTLVIFAFSARPALHASGVDWQDFLIKKTAHFVEYFILAFLVSRSFSLTTKLSRWQIFALSFLFASLYAAGKWCCPCLVLGEI
jgi:VanZ family protein